VPFDNLRAFSSIEAGDLQRKGCSKKGAYYLAYAADKGQTIEINLAGDAYYHVDIIDTWNMQITPSERKYAGKCVFELPAKPYMALRIIKQE